MFVKVTAGTDQQGGTIPDTLFEAKGMVEHGIVVIDSKDPDPDWVSLIGRDFHRLHVLEVDQSNPAQDADGQPMGVFVRWAGWVDHDPLYTGCVTTRNIYILGANGKTIDRV